MGRLRSLICLGLMCLVSTATPLDPRGARPVEHGTRDEKCANQKEWPFCTSDEWGPKCPSGCRIQGLLDKYDHDLLRKIEKIRSLLEKNKSKFRATDLATKQTYDSLKDKLLIDSGNDNNYYDLAQNLRRRITDMKIKIDTQLRILGALRDRVKDQVLDMQRLEVDIDIKLRSCKGSCQGFAEYQVDHESYVALEKQMNQLDTHGSLKVEVGTLSVMKSKPLKEVIVDSRFKTGEQRQDAFEEVKTAQLILEEEGSSSSPATISKEPGSYLPSSSSSSSVSSSSSSLSTSSSSKSITETGGHGGGGDLFGAGGGFDSVHSSHHVSSTSCTKSTRTTIVHTKDGPVEKTETVVGGGPECQILTDTSKGGLSSFFPTLSHASSSSSSSSSSSFTSSGTKTSFSGGAKGSLLGDSKTGFDPFAEAGLDLGEFLATNAEDDVPDAHARSVKTSRVERQADYVGKDCVDANRNHLTGETNGLFKIRPGGAGSTQVVEVYCQQEGLMGGWLLVQQREGGALSFNRTWAEYRAGFGSVDSKGDGEFWLGNQNLHLLTNQGETLLKVELGDWEGGVASAEYTVRVGSEEEGYPLHVSGYMGDAGDALAIRGSGHDGMKFSTFDRDNDNWELNCAEMYGGGWWYNSCQTANLNGVYYKGRYDPQKNGVVWTTFKTADYSLKSVRVFIRPTAF